MGCCCCVPEQWLQGVRNSTDLTRVSICSGVPVDLGDTSLDPDGCNDNNDDDE